MEEAAPEARVGVAHGQMSAREVENVMPAFQEHEIDVLVPSSLSPIDNCTLNNADYRDSHAWDWAQLYQLKGRAICSRQAATHLCSRSRAVDERGN